MRKREENKYFEIKKPKSKKDKCYKLIVGNPEKQIVSLDGTKIIVKLPLGTKVIPELLKGLKMLTRNEAIEKHSSKEYQVPFKSTDV